MQYYLDRINRCYVSNDSNNPIYSLYLVFHLGYYRCTQDEISKRSNFGSAYPNLCTFATFKFQISWHRRIANYVPNLRLVAKF